MRRSCLTACVLGAPHQLSPSGFRGALRGEHLSIRVRSVEHPFLLHCRNDWVTCVCTGHLELVQWARQNCTGPGRDLLQAPCKTTRGIRLGMRNTTDSRGNTRVGNTCCLGWRYWGCPDGPQLIPQLTDFPAQERKLLLVRLALMNQTSQDWNFWRCGTCNSSGRMISLGGDGTAVGRSCGTTPPDWGRPGLEKGDGRCGTPPLVWGRWISTRAPDDRMEGNWGREEHVQSSKSGNKNCTASRAIPWNERVRWQHGKAHHIANVDVCPELWATDQHATTRPMLSFLPLGLMHA